jgi:Sulfatase
LKWKLVFDVEWSSTQSLFVPQIPLFSVVIFMQPVLGVFSILLLELWTSPTKNVGFSRRYHLPFFNQDSDPRYQLLTRVGSNTVVRRVSQRRWLALLTIYLLLILTLRPVRPWRQLSGTPTGALAWHILRPARTSHLQINTAPPHWDQPFVDFVATQLRAPEVDLSKPPRAHLNVPIRNVVIINLESVRADALPLSPDLLESVNAHLVNHNISADDISPFWNSLVPHSLVMQDTSATSSYTLKTLLSTFCGMYPLNVNFMEEGRENRYFYQKCLPQLVRETFPAITTNGPSKWRRWWERASTSRFESAFFQTSESTFDHQDEEFSKMGWDRTFYAPDVRAFSPEARQMGWFGVGDRDLLPLFWNWVDEALGAKKQLLGGILTTSTHFPFPLPEGESYREYIDNELVNQYLNSIRMTDGFLRDLIGGFEERGVVNETVFVMIGDHGHGFDDWGHKVLGALDNPMENGFRVPFMVYSPGLKPIERVVEGKYTNLDILPSVMDILLSSSQDAGWDSEYPSHRLPPSSIDENGETHIPLNSTDGESGTSSLSVRQGLNGNLLHLTQLRPFDGVVDFLRRYEGTSIFRHPLEPLHPQRITFHLDNPGNAHVVLVQYPMKLVYDAIGEQTYLYDLSHDPGEWEDLLSIPLSRGGAIPPLWVEVEVEDLSREFQFGWFIEAVDEFGAGRTAPDRDISIEYIKPDDEKDDDRAMAERGRLNLNEAFDWAEDAFELLVGWSWMNRERYLTGEMDVDLLKSRASAALRGGPGRHNKKRGIKSKGILGNTLGRTDFGMQSGYP